MKLIGAGIMIFCGGALGFRRLNTLRKQVSLLDAMDTSLAVMEREISLCRRPLPDVFDALSRDGKKETAEIFRKLRVESEAQSAGQAWNNCLEDLEIPDEAHTVLSSLTEILGVYDGEKQSAEITYVRERIALVREKLKSEISVKGKSYPLLGVCFAGIAVMLLI